jgi:hypothetical protein
MKLRYATLFNSLTEPSVAFAVTGRRSAALGITDRATAAAWSADWCE